jgi:hypothetical protein
MWVLFLLSPIITDALRQVPALKININPESIQLVTPVFKFKKTTNKSQIEVDLYSMVHVADSKFYDSIEERCKAYDTVLYEMITSPKNYEVINGFKRLNTTLFSPQAASLASQFQLSSQLDMNMLQCNWYIADLDADYIYKLEKEQNSKVTGRFISSLFNGRSDERLTLKRFFISDSILTTAMRMFSNLLPCPELSAVMIDWSRTQAGGVPDIIWPILNIATKGQFSIARKIIFCQELVTGLIDSGDWGGASLSNTNIRVNTRNTEVIRVLSNLIQEETITSNPRKIAILYGAFHINDLSSKLQQSGFQLIGSADITAWDIPLSDNTSSKDISLLSQVATAITASTLYLLLGAIDWYFLFDLIAESIKEILNGDVQMNAVLLGIGYFITYIQRHSMLYNKVSSIGVQWQRGLFD